MCCVGDCRGEVVFADDDDLFDMCCVGDWRGVVVFDDDLFDISFSFPIYNS